MTKIQDKLMQLMDEIISICQSEDLHYVLAQQTAAYAEKYDQFINSYYDFQLMMPLPDIMKLERYVQDAGMSNREFESWKENSSLSQMIFRYIDTQSILIDGERCEYFQKPGIAITIHALKIYKPSKVIRGCERYLQEYNKGREKSFWIKITIGKFIGKLLGESYAKKFLNVEDYQLYTNETGGVFWGGLVSLFTGKDRLARFLIYQQDMDFSDEDGSAYWYMTGDGKLVSFSQDFFSKVQTITFENRNFIIPENINDYLKKLYGKDWKVKGYEGLPLSNRLYVISDSNLSYREYENLNDKEWTSMKKIMRSGTENNCWAQYIHDPMKERVNLAFQKIRRSVDQIDVWSNLKDKRVALAEAYKKRDIETLKNLLQEYIKKTGYYKGKGIGFYIDDDIFLYSTLVWESENKANYAEKIYQLVPDLYKKESVDEYFAERNKT